MKTIALLPMKAHSERVSGKNFKSLAGKPLFKWILDSLLAVKEIDQIIINTDARDILADHGLTTGGRILIRDRRREICGDHVSMNLIIKDDLETSNADRYLMTHTTNPLLSNKTILDALQSYENGVAKDGKDSLFGVTRYQTRFYLGDGAPLNHDPNNLIRTQDLEPWFEENSCMYVFNKSSFAASDARIGKNPVLFEVPKLEAIDIDNHEDWWLASAIAKKKEMDGAHA